VSLAQTSVAIRRFPRSRQQQFINRFRLIPKQLFGSKHRLVNFFHSQATRTAKSEAIIRFFYQEVQSNGKLCNLRERETCLDIGKLCQFDCIEPAFRGKLASTSSANSHSNDRHRIPRVLIKISAIPRVQLVLWFAFSSSLLASLVDLISE
jgi:hypothetical protein